MQNAEKLDSNIIYDRDFDYDYFGFKVGLLRQACVAAPRERRDACLLAHRLNGMRSVYDAVSCWQIS